MTTVIAAMTPTARVTERIALLLRRYGFSCFGVTERFLTDIFICRARDSDRYFRIISRNVNVIFTYPVGANYFLLSAITATRDKLWCTKGAAGPRPISSVATRISSGRLLRSDWAVFGRPEKRVIRQSGDANAVAVRRRKRRYGFARREKGICNVAHTRGSVKATLTFSDSILLPLRSESLIHPMM
ncbi:hypothetical protein J6590_037441 [Homalodisca vitripennis]|nr:hypothetical protein J6590_037441 [Homalodisca vitripennis]